MASLQVFVFLSGLIVLCHSSCYFNQLVVEDLNNPPKECVDEDGHKHDIGSEWVRDCMDCSCDSDGFGCCSMIPSESSMQIPEECEMVVDKESCSFQLVLKSEKTKDCFGQSPP